MPRLTGLLLAGVVVVLAALGLASPASAAGGQTLVSSSPGTGTRELFGPTRVQLTFNFTPDGQSWANVSGPRGQVGSTSLGGQAITIAMPGTLPVGTYTVNYSASQNAGEVTVTGAVVFAVGFGLTPVPKGTGPTVTVRPTPSPTAAPPPPPVATPAPTPVSTPVPASVATTTAVPPSPVPAAVPVAAPSGSPPAKASAHAPSPRPSTRGASPAPSARTGLTTPVPAGAAQPTSTSASAAGDPSTVSRGGVHAVPVAVPAGTPAVANSTPPAATGDATPAPLPATVADQTEQASQRDQPDQADQSSSGQRWMALPPVLLLLAFGLVVGSFLVSSRMSRNAAREAAAAPEQDPEVAQWLGELKPDAVPRPRPERLSPFSASRSGSGPAS